MPQGPFQTQVLSNATSTALNISAATQVKATNGVIVNVSVTTAGAAGAIYDSATVGGIGAANLIAEIPAVVGVYQIQFPAFNGIVVAPGAAQVVSVSYS